MQANQRILLYIVARAPTIHKNGNRTRVKAFVLRARSVQMLPAHP